MVVLLGLLTSAAGLPAAAQEDSAPDRVEVEQRARALAAELVGKLSAEGGGPAAPGAGLELLAEAYSDLCFDDPAGDTFKTALAAFDESDEYPDLATFYLEFDTEGPGVEPAAHPAADIKRYCAGYLATELELRMRVAEPVAPEDEENGLSYRVWLIDTTGDGTPDTYAFHVSLLGFQFGFVFGGTEENPVFCDAVADFSGDWFRVAEIPAGCIRTAETITIGAMTVDVPGLLDELDEDEVDDLDTFFDFAPDSRALQGPITRAERSGPRHKLRLFDSGRIGTAIKISQHQFPDGAPEVYLARADNYPDALAAGALTEGPILLVPSCGELPAIVAAEIARLDPDLVVALGGTGAICDSILAQAAAGRMSHRVSGATRIETAAKLAEEAWPFGALFVYLARADNFPDALAGGSLTGGPIVLVPNCGLLPDVVKELIGSLDPDAVIALGGVGAICDDILTEAGAGRIIDRYAGPNRFATAVEISKARFPFGAVEVYLARADNYPDALAGGVLTRGPILLVPACGDIPQVVADEIARLNPTRVVTLGGAAAVCDSMTTQAAAN